MYVVDRILVSSEGLSKFCQIINSNVDDLCVQNDRCHLISTVLENSLYCAIHPVTAISQSINQSKFLSGPSS